MECSWKENWTETKENFTKWWRGEGLVLGGWYGTRIPRITTDNSRD